MDSRILNYLRIYPKSFCTTVRNPHTIKKNYVLFKKLVNIKILNKKIPMYGSCDITNRCNLHCKHCYWWKNHKNEDELTVDEWREVIKNNFVKNNIVITALTGGEPLLRPDVIELFNEMLGEGRFTIITNGTLPLKDFGETSYFVSIDGTKEIHNKIRGQKIYSKIKKNVENYSGNVHLNMTINSLNCDSIEDVFEEWKDIMNLINFQFYTPFSDDDPLWLPFGEKRNEVIKKILKLKEKYPNKSHNTAKQLDVLSKNDWTSNCPTWAFLSVNHKGKIKHPCFIGGENKPICEKCGMCEVAGIYSALNCKDFEWIEVNKRLLLAENKFK